ncbi:MAG: ABC transporter permease [Dehalococcoidia bacterium]|nr:ABC transporter permease [Dehalococcoidia bacterium]
MINPARVGAFFVKWSAEIVRQPALMFSLVLGPFLVLLAFGQGVDIGGSRPRTIIVRPAEATGEMQPLPDQLNDHITIVGETQDLEAARRELRDGKVDAVVVVPADPEATVKTGERVPLQVLTSEIDPVRKSYASAYLSDQVARLNRETIAKAIGDAQASVGDVGMHIQQARDYVRLARDARGDVEETRRQVDQIRAVVVPLAETADRVNAAVDGVSFVLPGLGRERLETDALNQSIANLRANLDTLDARLDSATSETIPTDEELAKIEQDLARIEETVTEAQRIPAETLSAPFQLRLENIAPFVPDFAGFYAPAVLALLLQHLAITLGALSMARVRLIGLMDLLRVAPVKPREVVLGNYLSYATICVVAGGLLVALVVLLLDVPVFGSWVMVAAGLLLLVVASLGIGFVISLISSSEQHAAQLAMLILLASIFFSGFVFTLDRIAWPVRALSYALPSTYAIRTLQDVMLRGVLRHPEDLAILAGWAIVLFVVTLALFRREFRPR